MKILGLTIDAKFVGQVLISTLLGGLIGFGFSLCLGNNLAVFLCAVGAGIAAIGRLSRQEMKQKTETNWTRPTTTTKSTSPLHGLWCHRPWSWLVIVLSVAGY